MSDMLLTQDPRVTKYFKGSDVVVDLGCGSGEMLDCLSSRYKVRMGLDISDRRLQLRDDLEVQWRFIKADLNQRFPLDSGCADTVIANQVIEHVADPRFFAMETLRVLKAGGVALFTTPNIRYIKHLWRLVVKGGGPQTANDEELDGPWDDGHIHYFTHSDLGRVFKECGFSGVHSQAYINLEGGSLVRVLLDKFAAWPFVREFMSGNILLVATK